MLNFIGSTFYAEFERAFGNNRAINIVIAPTAIDNNEEQRFGIYAQINPKFYVTLRDGKHSDQFFYFSPYGSYRYIDISQTYNEYVYPQNGQTVGTYVANERTFLASSGSAGLLFGYKIDMGNFFVINFETGGGIRYILNKSGNSTYDQVKGGFNNWNLGYSGIYPRFNLTMGFKF